MPRLSYEDVDFFYGTERGPDSVDWVGNSSIGKAIMDLLDEVRLWPYHHIPQASNNVKPVDDTPSEQDRARDQSPELGLDLDGIRCFCPGSEAKNIRIKELEKKVHDLEEECRTNTEKIRGLEVRCIRLRRSERKQRINTPLLKRTLKKEAKRKSPPASKKVENAVLPTTQASTVSGRSKLKTAPDVGAFDGEGPPSLAAWTSAIESEVQHLTRRMATTHAMSRTTGEAREALNQRDLDTDGGDSFYSWG